MSTDTRAESCLLAKETRFVELNLENYVDTGSAEEMKKQGELQEQKLTRGFLLVSGRMEWMDA